MHRWILHLMFSAALAVSPSLLAQDHVALTILAPRDDLPAGHRMTRAYPGMPWDIRVAATGGDWPYRYELRNAPAGMSIVPGPCTAIGLACTAGTITWTSPKANATPGVRVCDRDGDCTPWEDWTITVSANGFRWIDAAKGNDGNNGVLAADGGTGPVRTMAGMAPNDTGTSIWVFRAGTYNLEGTGLAGARDASRLEVEHEARGGGNATMWLCHPGETCTIDFRYPEKDPAPSIKLFSAFASVEGFTIRRDKIKALEWAPVDANSIGIFRNNTFQEGGPGMEGANAAFIGTTSNNYSFLAQLVVQNSTFGSADHVTLKLYSLSNTLIESNDFADGNGGMDLKSVVAQYTVRANTFTNCKPACISGNMDEQAARAGTRTQGEVLFNYFNGCGPRGCLYYAEQFPRGPGEGFGPMHAYRNTFAGLIHARDVTSAEGNLTLSQNVLINTQPGSEGCPAKVLCTNVQDFKKIVLTNNLTGNPRDNIIDANGNLQGRHLAEHGPAAATPKGHMLGGK